MKTIIAAATGIFISWGALPAWAQSPPGTLQPGTYNAPSGTGAIAPALPALPAATPVRPMPPSSTFNQDILNLNQGAATQQLWLREQSRLPLRSQPDQREKTVIRVQMPTADAQLWVNGQLTRQVGLERTFVTPPLESGNYRYSFRAAWTGNETPAGETRTIVFQPAQEVRVDFTAKYQSGLKAP